MAVVWSFPSRILFGEGSAAEVGNEVRRAGGSRALIVTDKGVVQAGLVSQIIHVLKGAKVEHTIFDELSSNPREKEVLAATRAFKESKADAVVAIGGGSALDTGKLVRLAASHPLPLAAYDDAEGGSEKIDQPMAPMIAIPTTAGTGSEVGRSGVVTIEATRKKTVIFSPRLLPNAAILDPSLTVSLPPATTAATGFDALTHCVEAYCAKGDHPMADAIALEGIELIAASLVTAVDQGTDLAARGAMLKASMMGAVAFQKGLGACHSLAHPLSAEADLHHGLANALCLPAVLDFNRSAVGVRIARIARILGVKGDDVETLAFECSGAVRALRRKVGLPEGLGEAGIDAEILPRLAELAIEDACHLGNPRTVSRDDMLSLYQASM